MVYYASTDLHIEHENICKYEPRPHNHTELLIQRHNEVIGVNDVWLCLGDIIFGKNRANLKHYIDQIACLNKILVRGNHDKEDDAFYYRAGFSVVCDAIKIKGILFSHTPSQLSVDDTMNVHGHFHSNGHRFHQNHWYNLDKRHVLLAIENTNYYPVSLEALKNSRYTVDDPSYAGRIVKYNKK